MEKTAKLPSRRLARKGGDTASCRATAKSAAQNPPRGKGAWEALASLELDRELLLQNRVVSMSANAAATSFDILRTKLLLQMRENGWTRLAVTSPHPGCGKTTIACNLAVGMTRQPDLTAMLFDMDLRRPRVATTLGHTPDHSIREMIEGKIGFAQQGVRVGENLAISMARNPMADPTSLLLDNGTVEKLDEIEAVYNPDLMIFDLPPLLTGDDTRAFLKNVDCALLVLRAEETKTAQIDTSEREIAKYTNVLGMVLNHCRYGDENEGYGYY